MVLHKHTVGATLFVSAHNSASCVLVNTLVVCIGRSKREDVLDSEPAGCTCQDGAFKAIVVPDGSHHCTWQTHTDMVGFLRGLSYSWIALEFGLYFAVIYSATGFTLTFNISSPHWI